LSYNLSRAYRYSLLLYRVPLQNIDVEFQNTDVTARENQITHECPIYTNIVNETKLEISLNPCSAS